MKISCTLFILYILIALFTASVRGQSSDTPSSSASSFVALSPTVTLHWDSDVDNQVLIFTIITDKSNGTLETPYDTPILESDDNSLTALLSQQSLGIQVQWSVRGSPFLVESQITNETQRCEENAKLTSYSVDPDKSTTLIFQRPFNTKDSCNLILQSKYKTTYLRATDEVSGSDLSDFASVTQTGEAEETQEGYPPPTPHSTLEQVHGWFLVISWGIVIDVAMAAARYLRGNNYYLWIHGSLAATVSVGTIILGLLAYADCLNQSFAQPPTRPLNLTLHFFLGIAIMSLVFLQNVGGTYLWIMISGKSLFPLHNLTKKVHMAVGSFVYILAKMNIFFGFYYYNSEYGYWEYIPPYLLFVFPLILSGTFLFKLFHELKYQVHSARKYQRADNAKSAIIPQNYQKLLELLKTNASPLKINKEIGTDVLWVTLDDTLYVINEFFHPGGNFILEAVKGREVGRFIYGAYGLEIIGDSSKNVHSYFALEALDRYFVGRIPSDMSMFIASGVSVPQSTPNEESKDDKEKYKVSLLQPNTANNWRLASKTEFSSTTFRYEFEHAELNTLSRLDKLEHFGKHFKIEHPNHVSTRLYTLIVSQLEQNIKYRQELFQFVENIINNQPPSAIQPTKRYVNTLPLVIKNYNLDTAFSTFLYKSDIGTDKFRISGPFGLGLGLSAESQGIHHVFAAGTGIIPYLDFFDGILRKMIYDELGTRLTKTELDKLNIIDPKFAEQFSKTLRFKLYVSFREPADFIGKDVIEKLCEYSQRFDTNKDMFDASIKVTAEKGFLKFAKLTKDRFDAAYVKKYVQCTPENTPTIFICGPPVFNKDIYNAAIEIGVPHDKIVMV
jgi:hypothetical protein